MDAIVVWLTILGMALVAYLNRASFILLAGRIVLPNTVRRALRYVPPAVLTALVVPALLLPAGEIDLSTDNSRLFAGLIAAVFAWRYKNMLGTIVTGMTVLHVLRWLGAA